MNAAPPAPQPHDEDLEKTWTRTLARNPRPTPLDPALEQTQRWTPPPLLPVARHREDGYWCAMKHTPMKTPKDDDPPVHWHRTQP